MKIILNLLSFFQQTLSVLMLKKYLDQGKDCTIVK
jgi:hypothetical protein